MNRNCNDIEEALKKEIAITKAIIEAWKNVRFVTKKDGTSFKNLSRNIENAYLFNESYHIKNVENKLRVFTRRKHNEGFYCEDVIDCYRSTQYWNDERIKTKPNNIVSGIYHYDIYVFDIEDIKNAVAERIKDKEEYLDSLMNQLMNLNNAFNNFYNGYSNLIDKLKKETFCKDIFGTKAYYMILDDVTKSVH